MAVAVGPLVSGWLLEDHAWGSTFLINVPIAVLAVFGALALVPPSKAEGMGRIDYVGGLLSIVTVGSLIYAAIEGPHSGWGAGPVTAAVVAGVGLVAFVAWELRHPHPMLDVRKFALRPFTGSMLAVMFFFFGMFAVIYYATQFLQFVLGYGALDTGVRLLPLGGAVFLGSALTGMLTPKLGVKVMAVTGMAVGTAGMFLLTQIDKGSTYGDFLAPLMMLGLALGLAISPATDTIMGSFPESELGVGGGVNDTALELGGALGIAVLGLAAGHGLPGRADRPGGQPAPGGGDGDRQGLGRRRPGRRGAGRAGSLRRTPAGPGRRGRRPPGLRPRSRPDQPHRRDHHGRRNTDRPRGPAGPARVREEERRAGGRDDGERGGDCAGAHRVHPLDRRRGVHWIAGDASAGSPGTASA
ncbi:MFS transporter [Streptomyces purpurascens]